MSAYLYIEGSKTGDDSKEQQARCREAYRKLLEKAGFAGRMPRLVACGGRNAAFDEFTTAHKGGRTSDFVGMLIDSEAPVADPEKPWDHLKHRPGDLWERPTKAKDEQVLFMTTCMETWIAADRETLRQHYGSKLKESSLPPLPNLEARQAHEVQDKLVKATADCSNAYAKGDRSFQVLAELNPEALKSLPSFARCLRILEEKLERPSGRGRRG